LVDVIGAPVTVVKLDETTGDQATLLANGSAMFRFCLYCGSAFEHYTWQEAARIDAVSTVRGLQWAAEKGIPIRQFTSADINTRWTTEMDASMAPYKAQIVAALKPGGFVRLPSKTIAYLGDGQTKAWNGVIWELNNPTEIAMAIAGGFNGGYGVVDPLPITFSYLTPTVLPLSVQSYITQQDITYGSLPSVNGLTPLITSTADPR
jgi:hypothetical protein